MKRILIVGYGRSGKDTAAEILSRLTDIPYAGSTSWAAKELVADKLGQHPQTAWETRHQHREEWKKICDAFRLGNQTILIRQALESANLDNVSGFWPDWSGIVVGVRDRLELLAAKEMCIFDKILWIHRPGNPTDPTVTFESSDCDETILNDGSLEKLTSRLFLWAERHGLVKGLYLSGKTSPTSDKHRE